MRIIDDKPSPKVAKIVICSNCGVTLEYVKADTRVERRTDYTGYTDSYRILTCPACKETLTIEW